MTPRNRANEANTCYGRCWRLVVGGWRRLAVGGPLGRSLTKKKFSVPKDRPWTRTYTRRVPQ